MSIGNVGEHFQGAVGREVEDVAIGFDFAVDGAGRLDAKNRLHITRGGCGRRAAEHQDGAPLGDGDADSQAAARDGDRPIVVGDGVPNFFERLAAGVVVARDVEHIEIAKDGMSLQKIFERLRLVDARDDPERVLEKLSKAVIGERKILGASEQVEETTDGVFVDENFLVDAKELCEVESGVVDVDKMFVEHGADIVGEDVQARELGIRIVLERIVGGENFFGALLVGVSPIEGTGFVKVVDEIKRRAAEHQDVGAGLDEIFDDFVAESGGDALVRLVDDEHLPIDGKNVGVLIEVAADGG